MRFVIDQPPSKRAPNLLIGRARNSLTEKFSRNPVFVEADGFLVSANGRGEVYVMDPRREITKQIRVLIHVGVADAALRFPVEIYGEDVDDLVTKDILGAVQHELMLLQRR